jgi:uncharacterized protein (DUF927 family)
MQEANNSQDNMQSPFSVEGDPENIPEQDGESPKTVEGDPENIPEQDGESPKTVEGKPKMSLYGSSGVFPTGHVRNEPARYVDTHNKYVSKEEFDQSNTESPVDEELDKIPEEQLLVKWADVYLPPEYRMEDDGVIKSISRWDKRLQMNIAHDVKICGVKVAVTGRFKSADGLEDFVELTFFDGVENIIRAPLKAVLGKQEFKTYIRPQNLRIDDDELKEVIPYLNKCISVNEGNQNTAFKTGTVSKTMGWTDKTFTQFIVGEIMYCDNTSSETSTSMTVKPALFIDIKNTKVNNLIKTNGNRDIWVQSIIPYIKLPRVRFCCYLALSSILLDILDVQPTGIGYVHETTAGKTLTTQIAASQFGYAAEKDGTLIFNSNISPTILENIIATFKDLTVFFNEIGQMPEKTRKIFGYTIANGSTALRANSDRTTADHATLMSNVVLTGEISCISDVQTDGAAIRLSIITERPIPKYEDAKDIKALEDMRTAICNNYGFILPLFFEQLFKNKKELRNIYNAALDRIRSHDMPITTSRKAPYFAVIEVAGWLLEKVYAQIGIETINPSNIIDQIWQECAIDNEQRPMPLNALAAVYDFIITNSNEHFLENDERGDVRKTSLFGWFGENQQGVSCIDILKAPLDEYLTKKGFTALRNIYDYWRRNDIIHTSKSNENVMTAFHFKDMDTNTQKSRISVVRFKKDVVCKMLGMPPIEDVICANISQKDIENAKRQVDESEFPQNPYETQNLEW